MDSTLKGRPLVLPANIKKGVTAFKKTLWLIDTEYIMAVRSLIIQAPGPNVIKQYCGKLPQ
jgi:hypothetical protein